MSTEARAPGEDVEAAVDALDRLERTAISADYADEREVQDDALTVNTTLRDLSRKLEEARRERDMVREVNESVPICREHVDIFMHYAECVVCREVAAEARVEVLEEALRRIVDSHVHEDRVALITIAARALSPQPQEPATEEER